MGFSEIYFYNISQCPISPNKTRSKKVKGKHEYNKLYAASLKVNNQLLTFSFLCFLIHQAAVRHGLAPSQFRADASLPAISMTAKTPTMPKRMLQKSLSQHSVPRAVIPPPHSRGSCTHRTQLPISPPEGTNQGA